MEKKKYYLFSLNMTILNIFSFFLLFSFVGIAIQEHHKKYIITLDYDTNNYNGIKQISAMGFFVKKNRIIEDVCLLKDGEYNCLKIEK